jgi:sugar lactone lactonase YvrE
MGVMVATTGSGELSKHELKTLVTGGGYYEGPRWHEGRWWVSDFQRDGVYTVTPDGVEELVIPIEGQSSGMGWLPDGSMLIVSMLDHKLLRRTADGTIELYADMSEFAQGHANDMVVSADGHAYVGQFGFDIDGGEKPAKTTLLHIAPDRTVSVAADDLFFPNGTVITPDGSTLIVGEALGGRYTAFTIGSDGELTDRRLWAELGPMPVLGEYEETMAQLKATPDGCCLDAEGGIWATDPINRRLARVVEGGEITDVIMAPDDLYFWACMLGGDDGRTLLISCAPGFLDHGDGDGVLYTTYVEVPHAGLP